MAVSVQQHLACPPADRPAVAPAIMLGPMAVDTTADIDGITVNIALVWPAVGNYSVWEGDKRGENYSWWLDDTKAPLKKA